MLKIYANETVKKASIGQLLLLATEEIILKIGLEQFLEDGEKYACENFVKSYKKLR